MIIIVFIAKTAESDYWIFVNHCTCCCWVKLQNICLLLWFIARNCWVRLRKFYKTSSAWLTINSVSVMSATFYSDWQLPCSRSHMSCRISKQFTFLFTSFTSYSKRFGIIVKISTTKSFIYKHFRCQSIVYEFDTMLEHSFNIYFSTLHKLCKNLIHSWTSLFIFNTLNTLTEPCKTLRCMTTDMLLC